MKSDKDEVFRFIWDNRAKLQLREGAYTEVLSVRPSTRIGVDGFVVRETVAQYYQVARLTPDEMKQVKIRPPADYLRMLADAAKAKVAEVEAKDDDEAVQTQDNDGESDTTPLYGGAVLIFDEYGRVKYWVHNDVFGKEQKERLKYLWEEGLLQAGRGTVHLRATRLSTLHRLRALGAKIELKDRW